MDVQSDRFPAFISWLIVATFVCHSEATAAQEPHGLVLGPAVAQTKRDANDGGGEKSPSFLLPSERALQRIARRTAGDRTLKPLADATIRRRDSTNAKGKPTGYWRLVGAPTDDQIEIPTNGNPASIKVAGSVGICIDYDPIEDDGVGANGHLSSGLHSGIVTWRTSNPKILVTMSWFTKDSGAPDRLLAIAREELGREGLRLLPTHTLDWPAATPSERLSQLLPPDSAPPVTPRSKAATASPKGPARVFLTPYDAVAARNRAVANNDWEAYTRCLTPASQGSSLIGEALILAGMVAKKYSGLIKAIEAHLEVKLFDEDNLPGADGQNPDLSQSFEPLECEGIRIEGDKASGYQIDRRPAPAPEEVETHDDAYYLPRYFPIRFRRIGGSWLIDGALL